MFCCIPDPALACLLAGDGEAMADAREGRWVAAILLAEALALLMLGSLPWS
ncbi:hypothetical protein Rumeso_02021 [Rubellimicrobium mesophilum DSM 19309]|uniref:Uncharacterized protein n=1 Tax=Rubellimicrobium mesophilum DSM 19309 TaxID=442562 RepID=A0A017HRL7_9RHOB|nr:hypothetical protein [Rubellimicrobium mesophilum]EYD76409.1 hypothetical protein Rumeso_02021 [Rubellimicrobium mesophilum DSM 19309]